MPPVWPIAANTKSRVVEEHGYQTNVYRALSGREQREQLRRHPIGGIEADYLCDVAQHSAAAAAILYPNQKTEWIVPLWQYMNPSLSPLAPAATQIDCDTVDVPHRDALGFGDYAVIWSDPLTYETLTLQAISASYLTVNPITKTWGIAGVYVVPTRVGRLAEVISYRWINNGVLAARLRFTFRPCIAQIPDAIIDQFVIMDGGMIPATP